MISAAFQLSLTLLTNVIAFAKIAIISGNMKVLLLGLIHYSGVTLYQGGGAVQIFEGPLVDVPKARVECRICTCFLGGPGHVHPENV